PHVRGCGAPNRRENIVVDSRAWAIDDAPRDSVPSFYKRVRSCADGIAHGPGSLGVRPYPIEHAAGLTPVRAGNDRPGVAIPVLNEGVISQPTELIPHSPCVCRGHCGHATKEVVRRARYDTPGCPIPVLN